MVVFSVDFGLFQVFAATDVVLDLFRFLENVGLAALLRINRTCQQWLEIAGTRCQSPNEACERGNAREVAVQFRSVLLATWC